MIGSNAKEVQKSALAMQDLIRSRLQRMVNSFVVDCIEAGVDISPIGPAYGAAGRDKVDRYAYRPGGWVQEPGLTKGNWMLSIGSSSGIKFDPMQNDIHEPVRKAMQALGGSAGATWQLGSKLYFGNATPYLMNKGINVGARARGGGALEYGYSDQASEGVSKPLIEQIQTVLGIGTKLKGYFDGTE